MKKILVITFSIIMFVTFFSASAFINSRAESFAPIQAKSAYLMDRRTGQVLYGQSENEKFPIASMVKIMTALLTFEETERGNLSLDECVLISEQSAGMGGSQMFLDRGLKYPVTDLLKGVIVVSANDACVALAERISGSEEAFVSLMNERAKALGMNDTVFVNATGLPKEGGYSTAHDVALMLAELTKHPKYYDYSKIWLEDYVHPDGRTTTLTNTNKFVRFYEECDGGKTGYTSEAKFCLAACATRGDTRLISVVIGAEDSKKRFSESKRLLSYGFAGYKTEIIVKAGDPIFLCPIKGGEKSGVIASAASDLAILEKIGTQEVAPEVETVYYDVKAPISVGDSVGECTIRQGERCYTVKLIAEEAVGKATLGDAYKKIAGRWA